MPNERDYGYAVLHDIAMESCSNFMYLHGEDEDDSKIHFKVMSKGGKHDVHIADAIEEFFKKHNITYNRYRDRGFEVEGSALEALINLGKNGLGCAPGFARMEIVDLYSSMSG